MKNIVLCSDGTGNQGGYGRDTNVFKVYQAVNIHDAVDASGQPLEQITFYDQGVGTDKSDNSKNKYRTGISRVFGFGFAANVKHLYHFLARTYDPGDRVFLFGFSRGAATVRAFAGFVHACGLLDRSHASVCTDGCFDENKFRAKVADAFACYEARDGARRAAFKREFALRHDTYSPDGNLTIEFIGVWDTVSALGFPQDFSVAMEWFFKAADELSEKIWPHRFYDYELNDQIRFAYQALAIDDERTTFWPMIWDQSKRNGHVDQVWFAGAHSNVGGGSPRTGLSDIALDWMMTKAENLGLRFFPDPRRQAREGANFRDRLLDSRDGIAAYYRYGPRNLPKLCAEKIPEGMIAIHRTAFEKIKAISDAYAPDGLPANFTVVDSEGLVRKAGVSAGNSIEWTSLQNSMDKLVAARAMLYRVFVELTMAILVLSGLLWRSAPESIVQLKTASGGGILQAIAELLSYLTPVYFENFIYAVVWKFPLIFPLMLLTLFAIERLSNRYVNALEQVCLRMCALVAYQDESANAPARPSRRRKA